MFSSAQSAAEVRHPSAVFLSYAREDVAAAQSIAGALRSAGIEVWLDQEGGLEHGDEWDEKIRRQIRECVLFVPVISATTQARAEGYFRIEWDLAAERAQGIAHGVPFILPVRIDDTREADALVPDRFRRVQWTHLPGGSVSPDIQARFLKLWSHRVGLPSPENAQILSSPLRAAAHPPPASRASRSWKTYASIGLIAAAAGIILWRSHRLSSAPPAPAVGVPDSPATAIADKARAIYYASEFTPASLVVAEQLARQATDADPDSSYAWGVRAGVQAAYIQRNWAFDEKIYENADTFAKRALAINPDEVQALLALGCLYEDRAPAQAVANLRHALAVAPNDNRVQRILSRVLYLSGNPTEGLALGKQAVEREPRDVLARYDLADLYEWGLEASGGKSAENLRAELEQIDAGLALQPAHVGLLLLKARVAGAWEGDIALMRTTLDHIPSSSRTEDRAVAYDMLCGLWARDSQRVWEASSRTMTAFFEDKLMSQPVAWSTALAYHMAGKENLAMADWRNAEAVLRKKLQNDPENPRFHAQLASTLAWLGRTDEAAREIAPVEAAWSEQLDRNRSMQMGLYYGASGNASKAAPYLRQAMNQSINLTPWTLKLDPWWDKLRGQPEFEAVLKDYAIPSIPAGN
jgi:tetratricopeptide (TPR) repeat protein